MIAPDTAAQAVTTQAARGVRVARILRAGAHPAIIAMVAAAVIRIPTLTQPLIEAYDFRQTQTAYPAVIYARDGIDLLHPQVPVFGPPWTLPFEFPIYQGAASLLIRLGLSPEVALRSLSLAAFLGSAALLWLILERHATRRAAAIALAVFLFSPFAILWSRTSMIEYPATLGSLSFMLGALEWRAGRGRRWLAIALAGGSAAALVKITTAAFWVAPALLLRRRGVLLLVVVPAILGLAWSLHSDVVKTASPNTAFLTSSALFQWNFGGDRFSLDTWAGVLGPVLADAGVFLLPLGVLVVFRAERLLWAWFAVALVAPLLTFTHLYAVHGYYAAAVAPAIAALIGGGIDRLILTMPRRTLAGLIGVVVALAFVVTLPRWTRAYGFGLDDRVLKAAALIRAASPNGELVALSCNDWSPSAMFYADRRGTVLVHQAMAGAVSITDPFVCTSDR